MNFTLLAGLAGIALIVALTLWLIDRHGKRRAQYEPDLPTFEPRQDPPRARTRISKDNLTWEI